MKATERLGFFFMLLFLFGSASLHAQAVVGHVVPYRAESPHPYRAGDSKLPIVWQQHVVSRGAGFVRIHFTGLSLARGDSLTVSAPDGSDSETITGKGPYGNGDVWSFRVTGQEALVSIRGGLSPGYGYRIKEIVHGFGPHEGANAISELNCSTAAPEPVVCHANNANFWDAQRPVATLDFNDVKGKADVCTGWLAWAKEANLLITNNHCISDKKQLPSLSVAFNFQQVDCVVNGDKIEQRVSYRPVRELVGTNKDLDYTLLTLKDDDKKHPLSEWGVVIPSARSVTAGQAIYIPQHPQKKKKNKDDEPSPEPKKVAWFETWKPETRCTVKAVEGDEIRYDCNTNGGSSGSPVEDGGLGHAVALHSGAGYIGCPNRGVLMSKICADGAGHADKYLICQK
jgi:hypothetical protein